MFYIYSWKAASVTARELSKGLNFPRIRHTNSRFKGSPRKTVINYGASSLPEEVMKCQVIQSPEAVAINSHKLKFFQHMDRGDDKPRVPDWTTDEADVRQWLIDGNKVLARGKLTGHSGEGISILSLDNPSEYVKAPLYTKYVKKRFEYRVHFVGGKIIDFARKVLGGSVDRDSLSPEHFMVRTHNNGFIYMREGVELPEDVAVQAHKAIHLSDLHYGAVDIIYNEAHAQAYVLEINTAPGMEGQTLSNYSMAFKALTEGDR